MEISTLFQLFGSFSTLFLSFWASGPEGPGNSFSTPFPTLGPKGPRIEILIAWYNVQFPGFPLNR